MKIIIDKEKEKERHKDAERDRYKGIYRERETGRWMRVCIQDPLDVI